MENFSALFSREDIYSLTTTTGTNSWFTLNTISLAQQNMGYPQNVNFPQNNAQLGFPEQHYFVPFDLNMQFQNVPSFPLVNQSPLYPFPTGQSSVAYGMPNAELQGWPQPGEEEYRKKKKTDALMSKVARERRRRARQRSKSSIPAAPSVPEGTTREQSDTSGGSKVRMAVKQDSMINVFYTPDGKMLEEILTKQLKNSDVSVLGRIVLPKREAEDKLPKLRSKEGINIVLTDVYSGLQWTARYKYWSNNKGRMYILENAGDFLNYYNVQNGDFITIYEDELKNLYLSIKKEERNEEVFEPSSDMEMLRPYGTYDYGFMQAPIMHQPYDEADEYLAFLTKELSQKNAAEGASSLFTQCNDGGSFSSCGTNQDNIVQHEFMPIDAKEVEASNQAAAAAAAAAAAPPPPPPPSPSLPPAPAPAPLNDQNMMENDDQQNNVVNNDDDDVYGGLDNIFEIGRNNGGVDCVTDYKIWP